MARVIFGNEVAEKDNLLFKCPVHHAKCTACSTERGIECKPILTGRWGSGKSAQLLLVNRKLENLIVNDKNISRKLWYIDEKALNVSNLAKLYRECPDKRSLRSDLEGIWMAEIIRRSIFQLAAIGKHYQCSGIHWKTVYTFAKSNRIAISVWNQIPTALKIIKTFESDQFEAIKEIQGSFEDLFRSITFDHIQNCLTDIIQKEIQPIIAVEPIDTPTSALEEETGLAQDLVISLLNLFQSRLQPDTDQNLKIMLAIPWHRYSTKHLNFPQKLPQYKCYLQWESDELKAFINRRIEWEFRHVKRNYTKKGNQDAWSELFQDQIRNEHCEPMVIEDSFDYILRHTHHRPRDLQRLTRRAVEFCATSAKCSVDDVLRGTHGIRVVGVHIREAVRSCTREMADLLINEAARRYPATVELVSNLQGIATPFTTDELKRRIGDIADVTQGIQQLWHAGILGIEVVCKNGDEKQNVLPAKTHRMDKNSKGAVSHRHYFFEYNYDGEPSDLLTRYQGSTNIQVNCVLHPQTYEFLFPTVTKKWPVGL